MEDIIKIKYDVDGTMYDHLGAAQEAARKIKEREKTRRDKLTNSLSFIETQSKAGGLHTRHIFVVYDEGPIDFGDRSGPKLLGYVEGTLAQASEWAMNHKGFWGYGPGSIELVDPVIL